MKERKYGDIFFCTYPEPRASLHVTSFNRSHVVLTSLVPTLILTIAHGFSAVPPSHLIISC